MDRNIIFGPPGTGKTTYLLRIVEKELRENNVSPHRIAYLAFTNQAADEIRLGKNLDARVKRAWNKRAKNEKDT